MNPIKASLFSHDYHKIVAMNIQILNIKPLSIQLAVKNRNFLVLKIFSEDISKITNLFLGEEEKKNCKFSRYSEVSDPRRRAKCYTCYRRALTFNCR